MASEGGRSVNIIKIYEISIPVKATRHYTIKASSPEEAYKYYLDEPNDNVVNELDDEDSGLDWGDSLEAYFFKNLEEVEA